MFRAAWEGLFDKSVGYEIVKKVLPWLRLRGFWITLTYLTFIRVSPWVNARRLVQVIKYCSSAHFYQGDLWKIDVSNYDVVTVHGLFPILKDLESR